MSKKSSTFQVSSSSKSSGISHRKCVIVGQKMVRTEDKMSSIDVEGKGESDNMRSSGATCQSDCNTMSVEKQPMGNLYSHSPTGSVRSSSSSILCSSFSGLDVLVSSSESKLLDELKADIEATAIQLMKLKSEVEEIPILREKAEEAEKEKKVMGDDLSEKCEIVETMKQRLSVLHEQNSQLAQLTKHSSDSSEATLRMRNALVASLAQLKKLQGKVDEIPDLKAEISSLNQQIVRLKEQEQAVLNSLSFNLPEGVTALDYNSLWEENKMLKSSTDNLSNEVLQLAKSVELMSDSMDDMQKRIANFEKSASSSIPLSSHIKKLERDKEDLYDEIIRLKLDKSISHSIDTIYLDNECALLRKANSVLQSKLEESAMQFKEQKEKIALKLFEIEISDVKSHKFEVEKRLSDLDHLNSSPLTCEAVLPSGGEDNWSSLSPQFKAQILKLHQCQLQSEQSHHVVQHVLSEKEDLEKELAELRSKLDEKSIVELECKVKEYENKIAIAHAKINDLEKRLHFSQNRSTDCSTLMTENLSLKAELSSLQEIKSHSVIITQLKKQLSEEQQLHEVSTQKYKRCKEQKQKLEVRVKESKSRHQTLASEISNSVQLMKKYQVQCVVFEKEIAVLSCERDTFRKDISSLKAELEVMKAEHTRNSSPDISLDEMGVQNPLQLSEIEEIDSKFCEFSKEVQLLSEENSYLKQRLRKESEDAQKNIDYKKRELKIVEEKINNQLIEAGETVALEQSTSLAASQATSLEIKMLEEEKKELIKENEKVTLEKESLEHKMQEISDDKLKLSSKFEETVCSYGNLQSKLHAKNEEYCHTQSLLCYSETKLSHMLADLNYYKSENATLLAAVSAKDFDISDITTDLKLKKSEVEKMKKDIQCLNDTITKGDYNKLCGEIEGYKAIIKSLQRQLDEAESREVEHELLKQKIRMLEQSLGDSSHDNKSLIKLLHDTMQEIPSFSQTEQSLQDHNLQLEEQVSVLSQWNDKQRHEIEQLERSLDESSKVYSELVEQIKAKEELLEENSQLKRELKEVEIEVNALRRQVRADIQEEFQMKLETQTQLLAVFNQHNTLLQRQVSFFVMSMFVCYPLHVHSMYV